MQQIELWKIMCDVFLMLSLVWLGVRFLRSPTSMGARRQVAELEGSLRALIKEADATGRSLNDQLLKRQQGLEKLMYDLESAEHRVTRVVSQAEESRNALEMETSRARRSAGDAGYTEATRPAPRPSNLHIEVERVPSKPATLQQPAPQEAPRAPEAPNFQVTAPSPTITPAAPRTVEAPRKRTNIYGEEIQDSTPAEQPVINRAAPYSKATERYSQGLAGKIEREVPRQAAAPRQKSSVGIEAVYAAAEKMLKAGADLNSIARQTNLSIEDVRHLSRIMGAEDRIELSTSVTDAVPEVLPEHSTTTPNEDPRLGVLTGMKRQVQTL